jgi:hypothetical protein
VEPQHPDAAEAPRAAGLAVAGVALAGAAVWFGVRADAGVGASFDLLNLVEICSFLSFVMLGSLLVLRRPGHPVGWLLAGLGIAVLLQQASQQYAFHGLTDPADPPAWRAASWIAEWAIAPPLVLFVEALLLFPSGRPSTRAWRVLTWTVAGAGVLLTVGWAVATWPQRGAPLLTAGGRLPAPLEALRMTLIACVPVAVGSLLVRYRRAGREERLQLKWLLLAAGGLVLAVTTGFVAAALGTSSPLIDALGIVSGAGVAVAMALAVLRYRLYEIDRILSRTVAYSLLTAALAAVYIIGVVGSGALLEPVAPDSSLSVAASTLLVAGAFNPLRMRLQLRVDRRFNRSAHDAERAVAAFHARLRDHVQLEALREDLLSTVSGTVQPAGASLWLVPGVGATVEHVTAGHARSPRTRGSGNEH